jgi:crotonobetainyl-CoA:carnitine CoA-transferase CaiB-like acyl-CoA transferase
MTAVLAGIKVVELGTMITAPLAGMMLADLGAAVVKVERPDGGDPFRSFRGGLYSPQFTAYNRNKRSVTLDLRCAAGAAVLGRLLADADILIENYRPGVLDRFGFSAGVLRERYPALIWCSITGFGPTGPYSDRPAYDAVASAIGGISSLFLDPGDPQVSGPTISDNITGMYACYGILGALHERSRTGRGRRVEVNMLESAIAFAPDAFANHTRLKIENHARTRVAISQSFAFRCRDEKLIAIHLSSQQKFWDALVAALEAPELAVDERFATRDARVRNYLRLEAALKGVFATRTRGEWMARLEARDVPFAPVQTIPEVLDDPQVRHLETFYAVAHPTQGEVVGIHRPVWIDGGRTVDVRAPPVLGEHTDEVLLELGYSADEAAKLRGEGAV